MSHTPEPHPAVETVDAVALAERLAVEGVRGLQVGWVDNNGIVRSRVVPTGDLEAALRRGVGVTAVFAVFDSHDGITFAHEGLATPSGDVRLVPAVDAPSDVVALAGQPGLAWAHGRQVTADGEPWPYCQRTVLERTVARLADAGFEARAGFEIELYLSHEGEEGALLPAHRGPAYSANAVRDAEDFVVGLLGDLEANGLRVGQVHAEYGGAQVELALAPLDPLAAADAQVLARQTIHATARDHGLRASLAPLPGPDVAGNGWHLHTSLLREGRNALTGSGPHGLSDVGRGYVAGLLRELPGVVAVTAPSSGSLLRRRPHYWAGAYGVWGVENREAALRLVPPSRLLGEEVTNVELKACDASANPYLAMAVVLAAGLAGVQEGLTPPEPVQVDPGGLTDEERAAAGVAPLATTWEEQRRHLLASELVREVLGEDLLGAFVACRDADAAWAADRTDAEVLGSLRWLY